MRVDRAKALRKYYAGGAYLFRSPGCAEAFESSPKDYLAKQATRSDAETLGAHAHH
jgi:YHS domain-containing protein